MTTQGVFTNISIHSLSAHALPNIEGWGDTNEGWLSPAEFNSKNSQSISITEFLDPSSSTSKITANIEAMYIFLDNSQMKIFAESEHSYLITTVRYHPFYSLTSSEQNISLSLFEPIKELVWMAKRSDISKRNDWFNFTNYENNSDTEGQHLSQNRKKEIIKNVQIKMNNQPRIQQKEISYFSQVQPFWYYKNAPPPGVNMFSFSLYPKEYQPSGSCNMAQVRKMDLCIDTVEPETTDGVQNYSYDLSVYSVGYNILRIQNGTGGLVFSS